MILDTGKSGELVNVMLTCCRSWVPESIKESRKKATSRQSVTYQGMAPFITSICFAASSHNTTRWISLAFLIDMFSSSSSSSFPLFHLFFAVSFSSPHQYDGFCKRSCHIPPTQPCTRHLFTPENEVCDESQLPPRKLAVDSHLISLLQVDNCNAPHHTCLYSASMGELTRTPLIWVGVEGEHCPENASLFWDS